MKGENGQFGACCSDASKSREHGLELHGDATPGDLDVRILFEAEVGNESLESRRSKIRSAKSEFSEV